MDKLITILNGVWKLPQTGDYDPKGELCRKTLCTNVQCGNCPFDSELHFPNPDEHFVTQIHKTLEVMNHETRNSTPD